MLITGVSTASINPALYQQRLLDLANHPCVINLAVCMIMLQLLNTLLIKTAGEQFTSLEFFLSGFCPLPHSSSLPNCHIHVFKIYADIFRRVLLTYVQPWLLLTFWPQTAASTASWPACFASSWHFATWWWHRPRAEPARPRLVAAAAAAPTNWATTAAALVTWIAASWTPAASPRIAWKSAWSAAESAFPHRETCFDVCVWKHPPWKEEWKETPSVVTFNPARRSVRVCERGSLCRWEWQFSVNKVTYCGGVKDVNEQCIVTLGFSVKAGSTGTTSNSAYMKISASVNSSFLLRIVSFA